jgi:hypothetical protein
MLAGINQLLHRRGCFRFILNPAYNERASFKNCKKFENSIDFWKKPGYNKAVKDKGVTLQVVR